MNITAKQSTPGSLTRSGTIRRHRQTKIVATLGPASSSPEVIEQLFLAGVDVFRLNFSHGKQEDHRDRLRIIRNLEEKYQRPVGVLADLQGPKLRVGRFKNGAIDLKPGMKFRMDLDPSEGDESRVNLPHPEIIEAMSVGEYLLCDDGKVRLQVVGKGSDHLDVEVVVGKRLSNNKGVNVPGVMLNLSPLTEKDRKDLQYALKIGVDWIALSFVQRPEDVSEARRLIQNRAALMVKLEKPSAIEHVDALIDMADGVMLARGDLGVEIPAEDVPGVQKRVLAAVRMAGKPVIVATQMLESMIDSPTPTRAEASDVATAVYDGTDAVMLSAETAAGNYPLEAVSIMNRIAQRVEGDPLYRRIMDAEHPALEENAADAITAAACQVATTVSAAAITNYTTSGSTTLRTARERPPMPILCLTEDIRVARRMVLSFGVHPVHAEDVTDFQDMVDKACAIALDHDLADKGQRLVITAGVPFGTPGSTNILRVAWV